jgi:hypothetical protein
LAIPNLMRIFEENFNYMETNENQTNNQGVIKYINCQDVMSDWGAYRYTIDSKKHFDLDELKKLIENSSLTEKEWVVDPPPTEAEVEEIIKFVYEKRREEKLEKEVKSKFYVHGCIDEENDLWGNIACKLHIDPVTCGRQNSCEGCGNLIES